jgi:tRNA modification GTPase
VTPAFPTFACELTPVGRGAVAVIALEGDATPIDAVFRARNRRSISNQPIGPIFLGDWGTDPAEDVVVIRRSETSTEIHCHGGRAAVQRILTDLASHGVKPLSSQEWLARKTGAVAAECQQALTLAVTRRTAHHLLRQCCLLPEELQRLPTLPLLEQQERLRLMLQWSEFGRHLTQPWKVVLCGRPNVGKSSLMNAFVGFARSVVFDQPGTTRDVIAIETAFEGWPVELTDTAGLREADSELEVAGIVRARERLSQADAVVLVLDAQAGLLPEDRSLIAEIPNAICVWNKTDLAKPPRDCPAPLNAALQISAATKEGLEELMRLIVDKLIPAEPPAGTPFPVTANQIERLRELSRSLENDGRS